MNTQVICGSEPSKPVQGHAYAGKAAGKGAARLRQTIIVLDNNKGVRKSLCKALQSAGYSAYAAGTLEDASEICERFPQQIQLALLDPAIVSNVEQLLDWFRLENSPKHCVVMEGKVPCPPELAIISDEKLDKPFKTHHLLALVKRLGVRPRPDMPALARRCETVAHYQLSLPQPGKEKRTPASSGLLGVLGRSQDAPIYLACLMVLLILCAGIVLQFFKPQAIEKYWQYMSPFATLAIGFAFAKKSKS